MIRYSFTWEMTTVRTFPVFQNEPKLWILCLPRSIHDHRKTSFKILIIGLCVAFFIPNFIFARRNIMRSSSPCAIELQALSISHILNNIALATALQHFYLESRYKLVQILTEIHGIQDRINNEFKVHLSFSKEQKLLKYGSAIISILVTLALIYTLLVQFPEAMAQGVRGVLVFLCAVLFNIWGCLWVTLSILVKWIVLTILIKQNLSLKNVERKQSWMFRKIFFQIFSATVSFNEVYGLMTLYFLIFGAGQTSIVIYSMLRPTGSCLMKHYTFEYLVLLGLVIAMRLFEEKVSINVSITEIFKRFLRFGLP